MQLNGGIFQLGKYTVGSQYRLSFVYVLRISTSSYLLSRIKFLVQNVRSAVFAYTKLKVEEEARQMIIIF